MSRERARFENNVDSYGPEIAEELERIFRGAAPPSRRARHRTAATDRR